LTRLDCSNITFFSPLDERGLFDWARGIPGFVRWYQDTLVMQPSPIPDESLRELLALFQRYRIPMQQLAQFRTGSNERWFLNPSAYWHEHVFNHDTR
jgi:hypothetical protein